MKKLLMLGLVLGIATAACGAPITVSAVWGGGDAPDLNVSTAWVRLQASAPLTNPGLDMWIGAGSLTPSDDVVMFPPDLEVQYTHPGMSMGSDAESFRGDYYDQTLVLDGIIMPNEVTGTPAIDTDPYHLIYTLFTGGTLAPAGITDPTLICRIGYTDPLAGDILANPPLVGIALGPGGGSGDTLVAGAGVYIIPEPASMLLLLAGVVGLIYRKK